MQTSFSFESFIRNAAGTASNEHFLYFWKQQKDKRYKIHIWNEQTTLQSIQKQKQQTQRRNVTQKKGISIQISLNEWCVFYINLFANILFLFFWLDFKLKCIMRHDFINETNRFRSLFLWKFHINKVLIWFEYNSLLIPLKLLIEFTYFCSLLGKTTTTTLNGEQKTKDFFSEDLYFQ